MLHFQRYAQNLCDKVIKNINAQATVYDLTKVKYYCVRITTSRPETLCAGEHLYRSSFLVHLQDEDLQRY